ncbi:hypothetical protein AV530_014923 [Patagioenas fasciata monilis]|uniref:Uncharacterized protein n=1 Tax=Patagioenas fasciata monilis TaxID=372326 RepID=A0A1V4K0K4_PATFA|nr:hypothetical protein AV530_014923 [Patagioenas fasciata monilis]
MVLNSSPLFQILGLQDEAPALLEEPEEHFQPEAELTRIELCCPTINKLPEFCLGYQAVTDTKVSIRSAAL